MISIALNIFLIKVKMLIWILISKININTFDKQFKYECPWINLDKLVIIIYCIYMYIYCMYLYFFELMNYFYYIFYYRDFIDKIHTNILYNIMHILCLKVDFILKFFIKYSLIISVLFIIFIVYKTVHYNLYLFSRQNNGNT
jgi:hypothetical protein